MSKLLTKKFSSLQFLYFCFNWIVGFGFIAAMSSVITTGAWSLLSFVIASFLALAVMLVYSRASQQYPNISGGVYGYSKLVFGKYGRFFQGWNQLQQIFLLAASSPLFLVALLKLVNDQSEYQVWYYVSSLVFFVAITIIGIFGLKFSKLFIFIFAALKWLVIFGAVILVAYLAFRDRAWEQTFKGKTGTEISVSVIIANVLLFVFAFNGFNSLSATAPDVKKTNFKKLMMFVYFVVLGFYLTTFVLFLGIEKAYDIKGFQGVWQKVFGFAGIIIFIFGSIANRATSSLSSIYFYSRIIVPLVEDGYLPAILKRKNKFGEYANAMYASMIIIIISMIFLTVLPAVLNVKDAFSKVVQTGTIIYVNTYVGAFIIFLILSHKKIITIPLWEKIIYALGVLVCLVILVVYLFPFVVLQPFGVANWIMLSAYFGTLALGYVIWGFTTLLQKRKKNIKN